METRNIHKEPALSALLVAPNRRLADQLVRTLQETHAFQILADLKSYPPQQTLEIRIRQLKPEVVLLDLATDLGTATELIRFIATLTPPAQVVGLHTHNDSDAILKSLRSGASEFLAAPFEIATQREALARLQRLRRPETQIEPDLGNVIAFTSAKPGSGASTLATQTAFSMHKLTGRKVLLADFDLMGGTIGFYLKLTHSCSLLDALQHADHLDLALWNSLTVNCSGVDILPAPQLPFADSVEPAPLHVVIEYARTLYDWVILDLPAIFHRISLMSLSDADRAFLVSTSELPSLHLARKAITLLDNLGFPRNRFQAVVNRVSRRDGIGTADIEKLFSCPVHASFPNDYFALHRVVTLGQPLGGDGDLGKAIESLAGRLSGSFGGSKKTGGGFQEMNPAFSQG